MLIAAGDPLKGLPSDALEWVEDDSQYDRKSSFRKDPDKSWFMPFNVR